MPVGVTIKTRRGLAAEWASTNPILSDGEPGVETDTRKMKIGDDVTHWNDLPYTTCPADGNSVPLQLRRGTASELSSANQVLSAGEESWESDTGILKIGDGTTSYNSLTGIVPTSQQTTRSATIIIAASDSSAKSKSQADYVCDGTADNIEIQAALDALQSSGGKIQLSEGMFYLADDIDLYSNIYLNGANKRATILYLTNGTNKNNISAMGTNDVHLTNIRVSNLSVDGNHIGNDNSQPYPALDLVDRVLNGIRFEFVDHSIIDNVDARNCSCSGVMLIESSYNVITNCTLSDNIFDGAYVVNDAKYNLFSNIVACNNGDLGISFEKATYPSGPVATLGACNNTVSNSVFVNNGSSSSGWMTVMGYAIGALHSDNNIFIGNTIIGGGFDGILLFNSKNNTVTGNKIYDCAVNGIASSTGIENLISGNTVSNTLIGINITAYSGSETVTNNSVNSILHTGIQLSNYSSNCIISGNHITNCSQAQTSTYPDMSLDTTSEKNFITNNRIVDTATARSSAAILCNTQYNVISNNTVSGQTIPRIVAIATNIISNNIGYTTENRGTATIAATTTSIQVAHGLAAAPTRVQLTPTASTEGIGYYIPAKAATTFTITIDSAATSDISFDWSAVV